MMDRNSYPPGWDGGRVRRVLEHYEHQNEEDAAREDEAALEAATETMMGIPNDLVPAIRALISKR